jgi:hypothetical protein
MQRLSKIFGGNKKCTFTKFTLADLQTLKLLLDEKPTLYLYPYPHESIIHHFIDSFDIFANIDCGQKAFLYKAKLIDELVPIISAGLVREFHGDEKELEMYLTSVNDWAYLLKKDNYTWKECALKLRTYYDKYDKIILRELIPKGESMNNTFIQYEGIPPVWEPFERGEMDEYDGEYLSSQPYYDEDELKGYF